MSGAASPEQAAQIARHRALAVLADVGEGDRIVVRFHDGDLASDALGTVQVVEADAVTVETRRGLVTVPFADVIAAKRVPPPPAPRVRRSS